MSRGNPSSGRQVSDLRSPSMSTPRPSEADAEVLLSTHRLHASMNHCLACRWRPTAGEGGLAEQHARHLARVLSGHLAARDAVHEREVVGAAAIGRVLDLDGQVQQARLRAEAAERALADLRGEIEALADDFDSNVDWSAGRNNYGDNEAWESAARQVRALLSRDDTAGAGGAE